MVESTAGVCGGRARIAGTRVPVDRLAWYHRPADSKTAKIQPYDSSQANTSEKRQTGRVRRQFGHAWSF
jgi:hypothetical protein